MPNLKAEVDKMEREGIIRPCPDVTDWVHKRFFIAKQKGNIQICPGSKNLDKYLIRSVRYSASSEDAQHNLSNGRHLSTLDGKS